MFNAINAFGSMGKKVGLCWNSLSLSRSLSSRNYCHNCTALFILHRELCIMWLAFCIAKKRCHHIIPEWSRRRCCNHYLTFIIWMCICVCVYVVTTGKGVLHNACLGNLINAHNSRNIQIKQSSHSEFVRKFIHCILKSESPNFSFKLY